MNLILVGISESYSNSGSVDKSRIQKISEVNNHRKFFQVQEEADEAHCDAGVPGTLNWHLGLGVDLFELLEKETILGIGIKDSRLTLKRD